MKYSREVIILARCLCKCISEPEVAQLRNYRNLKEAAKSLSFEVDIEIITQGLNNLAISKNISHKDILSLIQSLEGALKKRSVNND